MSASDYLAHEIELAYAKDRVRLLRSMHKLDQCGGKKAWIAQVAREFDPLAATCLAQLIETRMCPQGKAP